MTIGVEGHLRVCSRWKVTVPLPWMEHRDMLKTKTTLVPCHCHFHALSSARLEDIVLKKVTFKQY